MPEAEESIVSSRPLAARTTTGRVGGGDKGGGGNHGYGEAGGEVEDRNRGLKDFVRVFDNAFRNGNEFVESGPSGGVPSSPRHFEAQVG